MTRLEDVPQETRFAIQRLRRNGDVSVHTLAVLYGVPKHVVYQIVGQARNG